MPPMPDLVVPDQRLFDLPERVIQFGTGVLLRGLPDYFIDKANRQGIFNGRIVVIKSTDSGGADAFNKQDGLYTFCMRGIENNIRTQETIINSSISRVLSAASEWKDILQCAHDPNIKLIISNTTEVGIVLMDDHIANTPPSSFPGKLLAFLVERYGAFGGDPSSGMVIIPTELITDNGGKLRSIVLELAHANALSADCIGWIATCNHFCSSLVDRIVPGRPPAIEQKRLEEQLGYSDDLLIMAESFRLWAIESADENVSRILSFSQADSGVVITPVIEKFRELKLRLLNGTHSFCSGLAVLAGFGTVREAMNDGTMAAFVRRLMMLEIAAAMDSQIISYNEACAFANTVMDRFRNPFMDHQWLSVTVNFTSKMRLRNIPLLLRHYSKSNKVPEHMAMGFAAYLLFMNCSRSDDGNYYGEVNRKRYPVQDEWAEYFAVKWAAGKDVFTLVNTALSDAQLWGADLTQLNGFPDAVAGRLDLLVKEGALPAIGKWDLKKTIA